MRVSRRSFVARSLASTAGAAWWLASGRPSRAQDAPAPAAADPAALTARAVAFLRSRQEADGGWAGDRKEPGITALVIAALLRSRQVTPQDPAIVKGLESLQSHLDPDGGVRSRVGVYATSVALMAFQEANRGAGGKKYDAVIRSCQDYLRKAQFDEDEGKSPSDPQFGGLGYGTGGQSRPDLSNTAFMIEALHDSGVPADDPALQKALVFVSRCQNLDSEFNDQPWAKKVNDGGFIYTSGPAAPPPGRAGQGREAEAAKTRAEDVAAREALDGGIPSTAGMTYSGLKSMLYAGLTEDDPRVKAALDYIAKNYTLDQNPGGGQRGLYYFYMMFARAMAAMNKPTFTDASGKVHDWKAELAAALATRQAPSGAWVNADDRVMEGDPNIVTAYCLIALAAASSPA